MKIKPPTKIGGFFLLEYFSILKRPFGFVLKDNLIYLNKVKHYTLLNTQEQ